VRIATGSLGMIRNRKKLNDTTNSIVKTAWPSFFSA
jgi:hypothetical protein